MIGSTHHFIKIFLTFNNINSIFKVICCEKYHSVNFLSLEQVHLRYVKFIFPRF